MRNWNWTTSDVEYIDKLINGVVHMKAAVADNEARMEHQSGSSSILYGFHHQCIGEIQGLRLALSYLLDLPEDRLHSFRYVDDFIELWQTHAKVGQWLRMPDVNDLIARARGDLPRD